MLLEIKVKLVHSRVLGQSVPEEEGCVYAMLRHMV